MGAIGGRLIVVALLKIKVSRMGSLSRITESFGRGLKIKINNNNNNNNNASHLYCAQKCKTNS